MIDPKELRLGNLVQHDSHICHIWNINDSGRYFLREVIDGKPYVMVTLDIDPIPITPEWLERLGAVRNSINGDSLIIVFYQTDDEWYDYEFLYANGKIDVWFDKSDTPVKLSHIKYVHQLQNVFHALTGSELTIKEPQTDSI